MKNWYTVRCDNSGPNCVQVTPEGGNILIRDSERPDEVVTVSRESWQGFLAEVRDGRLDHI